MSTLGLFVTALLFGGMVAYSFAFAPILFRTLSADQAGRVLRFAFPHYYLFVILTAVAALLLVTGPAPGAAMRLAAVAILAVVARQLLMPRINAARDAGSERTFRTLHGVSVAINVVQLVLVAGALAAFTATGAH